MQGDCLVAQLFNLFVVVHLPSVGHPYVGDAATGYGSRLSVISLAASAETYT
jgi:hypothetical protein